MACFLKKGSAVLGRKWPEQKGLTLENHRKEERKTRRRSPTFEKKIAGQEVWNIKRRARRAWEKVISFSPRIIHTDPGEYKYSHIGTHTQPRAGYTTE